MALAKQSWKYQGEYYKDLIIEMVKAELRARHFQKLLGPIWWVLEPTFMALVYFFITTVMFRSSTGTNHLLFILTAVIAWRWFSRTIDNAPYTVVSYAGLFKQTNFPALIVLFVTAASEMIFFFFGMAVLVFFCVIYGIYPSVAYIYLPLIILTQLLLSFGMASILATLGVFVRDLGQLTYVVTAIWFYLSPGIYPIEWVPKHLLKIYYLNPFATIMPAYRSIIIEGKPPSDLSFLLIWSIVGVTMSIIGIRFFLHMRVKFYKYL